MLLHVTVITDTITDPASPEAFAAAHDAASQQASAWTAPVHLDTTDQPDGTRLIRYTVDAVPRTSAVTTANIAPTLLPPRIG